MLAAISLVWLSASLAKHQNEVMFSLAYLNISLRKSNLWQTNIPNEANVIHMDALFFPNSEANTCF